MSQVRATTKHEDYNPDFYSISSLESALVVVCLRKYLEVDSRQCH